MTEPPFPEAHELRARNDAIAVVRAGTLGYRKAWQLQRRLVERRTNDEIGDVVLLLEHPRVFTAGRRADRDNLVFTPAQLEQRGIDVVEVDRGGDFTYHGPGQLVGYPIMRLAQTRGVVQYVRALEEVNIVAARSFGVHGTRIPDFTGVWVGQEKLTAIGVRVLAGGVTQHGFATNVTTDLADFGGIIPCGITDKGVCSLASLGVDADLDATADAVTAAMAEVFRTQVREATLDEFVAAADLPSSP